MIPVITAENEISTDEAEIRQMAKIGSQKGVIEADEAAMILKVFQLNDLKAKDLPIIKFIVFKKTINFGEDALKTIYGFSYGSEIGIINFIL